MFCACSTCCLYSFFVGKKLGNFSLIWFARPAPSLRSAEKKVGYWMWEVQQISLLFDSRHFWYWFISTGFLAVLDFRLLIISLIAFVFSGCVAMSNLRLLIISLLGFAVVPSCSGGMRLLCWWNLTVRRRKILRGGVRLPVNGSVNVHGCSHVESGGGCRESWRTLSMSNAFTAPVFNLIVKCAELIKPTGR